MALFERNFNCLTIFLCFLLYAHFNQAQVIIARHENCQDDDLNRVGYLNSITDDQSSDTDDFESTVSKWCKVRSPPDLLDKCEDQIQRLCNPLMSNNKNNNFTGNCPFLIRKKRQDPGKTEKASKEDLAKLKSAFGKLATDFFANLVKSKPGGSLGDVPMNDGPSTARNVQDNELQLNDPDNYMQGDVDVSKNQANHFFGLIQQGAAVLFSSAINKWASGGSRRKKRKVGKESAYHLWNVNPIPYQFHRNVPTETRQIIEQALNLWQSNTCRRWAKDIAGLDRVEFVNGDGCSSFVGKTGGTQEISIRTPGCDVVGISSHEIGHSLGFFHEQGRPDQASNVQVNFGNVLPNRKDNFVPMPARDVNTYGIPYEFGSVMHYDGSTRGFTYNPNKYSIITKDPKYQNTIGQRVGPSFIDYKLINLAYCSNTCPQKLGCTHLGYEDPNNCMRCKCPGGLGGQLCDSVAPSSPGCGGVIRASKQEQYITSPNFPSSYPKGMECNWYIIAPAGGKIYLRFDNPFSFPCDEICTNSFVEVKAFQDFQRTGYRFCCNKAPDPVASESNEMVIIFKSNGQSGNGFRAIISTDASGNVFVPTAPPNIVITQAPVTAIGGRTPKGPQGCDCEDWGAWSVCTQPCGGCGYVNRQRRCNRANCFSQEKKHCNFNQCPSGTNVLINNGQFDLLFSGCCVGTFPSNGNCGGLTDAVSQFFTGLISNAGG